jgi:hypothetical protein
VYDYAAPTLGAPEWRATGFVGTSDEAIRLDSTAWTTATGSYRDLGSMIVGVDTATREYGRQLDPKQLVRASELPDGMYLMGEEEVSAAGFYAAAAKFSC